jgi:asparagine synthase (glutamine-hydrolysing)
MAFGIEARVPFLDHRLVEHAVGLPDRLKIQGRERKVALRRAAAGIVPASVLARRDKIGFASPEDRWFHAAQSLFLDLASNSRAERDDLLSSGTLAWALERWRTGGLATAPLWRVMSLELWLRTTVEG